MEFIYLPNDSQQVKQESLQKHSLYIPLIIVSHHHVWSEMELTCKTLKCSKNRN